MASRVEYKLSQATKFRAESSFHYVTITAINRKKRNRLKMQSRYTKSFIVTGILNNPKFSKALLLFLSQCLVFTEITK